MTVRAALASLLFVLPAACSDPAETTLVPISVIAASDSSRLSVTAVVADCSEASTDVIVEERGPIEVAVAVRFGVDDSNSCTYGGFFTDFDAQLDGPLGDRVLVLVQPDGYNEVVGNDVCIIDDDQRSRRCTVEVNLDQ